MSLIKRATVVAVVLGVAALVGPVEATASSPSTAAAEVSSAPHASASGAWRVRFGKQWSRHVIGRDWAWVDRHARKGLLGAAKTYRKHHDQLRLLKNGCGNYDGPRSGYCYYRNVWVIYFHKSKSGRPMVEAFYIED